MATGDYHHTALAVARGVGMIPPQGQVIIIHKASETHGLRLANSQSGRSGQDFLSGMKQLTPFLAPAGLLQRPAHAVSFAVEPQIEAESSESARQGLVFQTDNGSPAEDDALQALTLMAQVHFTSHKFWKMRLHLVFMRRIHSGMCDAILLGNFLAVEHTHSEQVPFRSQCNVLRGSAMNMVPLMLCLPSS